MEDRDEIGFYLKRINDFLLASANEHLKSLGLTFSQFHILLYILHGTDATVLQKEIEQYFRLKHPTVVGLLKRMEKKELIRVEVNPEDRRGNLVIALPKGINVGNEMRKGRNYANDILTRDLDEKQKNDLKELLKIIYTKTCIGDDKNKKIRPLV
ncbi:MAG: MarR family transcriptional regulator [Clostridia bacterium]|nr:MarR family transcriptional regulator [Clostridia bacterium]